MFGRDLEEPLVELGVSLGMELDRNGVMQNDFQDSGWSISEIVEPILGKGIQGGGR